MMLNQILYTIVISPFDTNILALYNSLGMQFASEIIFGEILLKPLFTFQ